MEHTKLNISEKQKSILLGLADILENLSPHKFHMGRWLKYQGAAYHEADKVFKIKPNECGTVGCAVGHAVINRKQLGLRIKYEDRMSDSAMRYIDYAGIGSYLVGHNASAYRWLFSGGWDDRDNDPKSTAKRIRYTVNIGVPENFHLQMLGRAPLSYLNYDGGKTV